MREDIMRTVDHTLLDPCATWDEIRQICVDAILYGTASVCIPAAYVKRAKEYVGEKMKICTVIGFPNGYARRRQKYLRQKMRSKMEQTRLIWSFTLAL